MILNTGARTDTVQYFSDWLFRRFKEGYVCARNPLFPNKVIRYELSPVLGCVAVILIVAAFLVRERGEAYDRKGKPYSEELPEKPAEEKVEPKEDEPETRSRNG